MSLTEIRDDIFFGSWTFMARCLLYHEYRLQRAGYHGQPYMRNLRDDLPEVVQRASEESE